MQFHSVSLIKSMLFSISHMFIWNKDYTQWEWIRSNDKTPCIHFQFSALCIALQSDLQLKLIQVILNVVIDFNTLKRLPYSLICNRSEWNSFSSNYQQLSLFTDCDIGFIYFTASFDYIRPVFCSFKYSLWMP